MKRRGFLKAFAAIPALLPFLGKSEGNIPTGIYLEKASEGECVSFTLQKEVTGKPVYEDKYWATSDGVNWEQISVLDVMENKYKAIHQIDGEVIRRMELSALARSKKGHS